MRVLRWERPPPPVSDHPRGGRASQWDDVAAELRANPGVPGVIYEGPAARVGALVTKIRSGGLACFCPAGAFEGARRNRPDGVIVVYAWYVGDEGEVAS